ncbi:hypothetical protein SEA_MARYBETH_69 [Mycobacterium phage MaryBeth]|nr:hypothetical protein SEA_METALQZJ_68 [Mycobacterium phage MetalQZJ]QNJ55776.1 hypothetical protein SEA_MARYBETH_69 [Mycobacterium phage MaryBeth]
MILTGVNIGQHRTPHGKVLHWQVDAIWELDDLSGSYTQTLGVFNSFHEALNLVKSTNFDLSRDMDPSWSDHIFTYHKFTRKGENNG